MGEEPELEPKEILRRVRIETLPYIRRLAAHRRAVIPRIEVAKRWIEYYEALAKTRPLKPNELRKLESHRKAYDVAQKRLEVLRAAGRYARTRKPTDLLMLRQAQSRYYEAKAELVAPEKRREFVERHVPPRELYEEIASIREDIEEKCKKYKALKYKTTPEAIIMAPFERERALKELGKDLSLKYMKAYQLGQRGMSISELVKHYKEMKEMGAGGP